MKASGFHEDPAHGTMSAMSVTVLLIGLALVAVGLLVTAFRLALAARHDARSRSTTDPAGVSGPDPDVSEIRRGDRPEPPADPTESGPDNVSPFFRPNSGDERR